MVAKSDKPYEKMTFGRKLEIAEVDAIASSSSEAGRIEWYSHRDIQEAEELQQVIDGLLPRVDRGIKDAGRRQAIDLERDYTKVSKRVGNALTELREVLLSLQDAASTAMKVGGNMVQAAHPPDRFLN